MGQSDLVINEIKKTMNLTGAGAGGTRNISGTTKWHTNLEKTLANFGDMIEKCKKTLF